MQELPETNAGSAVTDDRDAYLSSYFGTSRHSERDERRRIGGFAHNYEAVLPVTGSSYLEIGPGKAEILQWLNGRGNRVHAVDVSSEVVDYCNDVLPGCAELVADTAAWLSVHPAEFDVVIMLHVLEHLPKQQVVPHLRAIRAALKPGGRLVVEVPNMGSLVTAQYMRYADWTHEVGFTAESLRYVLVAAGFRDVVVRGVELPPDRWYRMLQRAALSGFALVMRLIGLAVGVRMPGIPAHHICTVVQK